ncbi:Glutamate/aspartate import permease protein GltJ [Usitatibacter rugosus]|jgi:glutamate/aspartate transport system permease protein|uniref:Glutamate/aspartate import permease protein GltJ n=1 Tax=Usitatibacter rugosus TaxID=2732067 RepID=A0A6M4GVT3_9PROT|nr:amino acid ABC transporter permease [Usitatibacter rugosus]QJR11390.1 Glutamate/aspartate import permease protein GltJ [Usitatibacter rugosus]
MDWKVFLEQAPSGGMTYLGWLASGTMWTLLVSIFAWIIAFSLGSVLGVMRTTPLALPRTIATTYVEIFRNVPLLVQMFLWYFVMPELVPKALGDYLKQDLPNLVELPFAQFSMWEFTAAVLCLGLYTASRVAEQVRAGILSLPRGQTNAGLAMGFTLPQVYRFVLVPMAFRIIIPPMTSEFLTIFKNSSTALTIGVIELTAQSRQISEYTFKTFEAFTAATLIYVAITLTVIFLMRWLEKSVAVPGYISQAAGH